MVRVKIPNYVVKRGRGFWQTTVAMREAGFEPVPCGPEGPEAWRTATECNARWAEFQAAAKGRPIIPSLPIGSLAEAFQRYRGTPEWSGKAPATRTEWLRAWTHIEPVFGDVRPRTVILEHLSMFREAIEQKVSRREAHRVIKIWRALWKVSAAMGYCGKDEDPSQGVRNYSLSRAKPFGPTAKPSCSSKAHGGLGITGLQPPLRSHGIYRFRQSMCGP